MITWLDNSKLVAILAVIFLHVSAYFVSLTAIGSQYWWMGDLFDSIVRWCVPAFVMISGALLLDLNKKEDTILFYKRRLSRIFWPIIFWSAFYLFWTFFKGLIKGTPPSALALASLELTGQPYSHMWFLYMIIVLYLFTPFIRKVIAQSTERELGFLVGVMLIIAAMNSLYIMVYPSTNPPLFVNWFLSYTPYFIIGSMIRQSAVRPSIIILWLVFGLSFLATALGCYFIGVRRGLDAGLYFYDYLSVTVIPMSICIMFLFKHLEKPIINEGITHHLATLTLGIYLIHPVILEAVDYGVHGVWHYNPLITIPGISIFVFFISLLASWCLSQLPLIRRII